MNKIEPIGIGGLHRGLSIPEIYIENTKLHDEVKQLKKNRDKAIEFLKTEHMTYDSAWQWRQALINILKGDSE